MAPYVTLLLPELKVIVVCVCVAGVLVVWVWVRVRVMQGVAWDAGSCREVVSARRRVPLWLTMARADAQAAHVAVSSACCPPQTPSLALSTHTLCRPPLWTPCLK